MGARRFVLWLGVVCLAQTVLSWHFLPPEVVFSDSPIAGGDYDTHAEQTMRALEGLQTFKQSWVYDVKLLAGFPNGTIFDADNKAWELFTFALHRLGASAGLSFNLFVLVVFLLLPPSLALAARAFGLSARVALVAAALGCCLWFFDSFLHWLFCVGTISFLFASYLSVLGLAVFFRWSSERRPLLLLAAALLLSLGHLVHPYTFFVLCVPMSSLYLRVFRSLRVVEHLQLVVLVASVVLSNAFWLRPAFANWHYILDSGYLMAPDLKLIGSDLFELVLDVQTTGVIATRSAFRVLCLLLAVFGLRQLRRQSAPVFATLAWSLSWLMGLAYLGALVPPLRQIQPYRFLVPALFVAVHPAAHALVNGVTALREQRLPPALQALAVTCALGLFLHLAAEVLYFFPKALPKPKPIVGTTSAPFSATGFALHGDFRVASADPQLRELARWLDAHHREGRVAVQQSGVGERLAWSSRAEILGGFVFCNLEHSRANPFRRLLEGMHTVAALRTLLEAYAVRYVVLEVPLPLVQQTPELFEEVTIIGSHHVYRTKWDVSWFLKGKGQLQAETNRILVWGTDPNQELVLRYHFHELLICDPHCKVAPTENPAGGVPFIRIPAPHPAAFLVDNRYGR